MSAKKPFAVTVWVDRYGIEYGDIDFMDWKTVEFSSIEEAIDYINYCTCSITQIEDLMDESIKHSFIKSKQSTRINQQSI